MEEGEESEGTEQFEVLGVLRLPLAPGTQSGYLGVRPNKSFAVSYFFYFLQLGFLCRN